MAATASWSTPQSITAGWAEKEEKGKTEDGERDMVGMCDVDNSVTGNNTDTMAL
jgi:hypothetical protein